MPKKTSRDRARYAKAPAIVEALNLFFGVEAKANDKVVRTIKKALKHRGLDAKRDADWDYLRAIVLDSERKRERKRKWSMETLALFGMRVEELKAKHPEENDYQRAEKLQASFVKSGVSQASAESLRKLFPAARRAFREWMVRRGRV